MKAVRWIWAHTHTTNQPVLCLCLCEYVHLFVSHLASVYSPESNLQAKTESHNLVLLPAKPIR